MAEIGHTGSWEMRQNSAGGEEEDKKETDLLRRHTGLGLGAWLNGATKYDMAGMGR